MFRRPSNGGSGGSRSRKGADLTDLVPFMQGSDQSFHKLRARVEKEDDVIRADQLTRMAKLGEGGFGIVYQCKLEAKGRVLEDYVVASGNLVAVKQLKSRAQILQEHYDKGAKRSAPSRAELPPATSDACVLAAISRYTRTRRPELHAKPALAALERCASGVAVHTVCRRCAHTQQ